MCAIDITAEQRKTVLALLARHLPNTTAWVYGSRVKWTSRPESDLDLVVFAKPEQERRVSDLREAFEESNLPFRVDLFVWDDVPEQFRKHIEAEHVVLVEREERSVGREWQATTLGDLVDITHGFAFKGHFIHDEPRGDVLLTPGNFAMGGGFKGDKFKYYNGLVPEEFVLREGDLLVTMTDLSKQSDTLGYPAFVPACTDGRRYLHNQRLGKISLKEIASTHARYLYYVMCGAEYRDEVLASATGTTVKHTSPDRIKRFHFPVPHLPEQRGIAHVLGTLDDKIELNRRMNRTLEEMARALFKSWFVDFDPVRANATLRHHATALTQGGCHWSVERAHAYLDRMNPNIAALFPDRFVESELGPIPEGWEVKALGDFVVNFDSKRIPVSKARRVNRPGIFPYYGAAGLMDYIDGYTFDGIYLLIGEDGSVVKSNDLAVTQYVWGRLWVNNHAHVLQGRGCVSTEQLYLYFNFEPVGPYVTGAVQPKLSQGRMNTMPFVFAGDDVCRAFATAVDPWFAKLRSLADASKILGALRDTMLPKLLLGEIRIKDIAPFGSVPQLAR